MSKQFYLTTAIDYVNGEPHLGHAYEKVITDIIARVHRSLGQEVFYLTGLDEHGQKVQAAANDAGKDPQAYCDEFAEIWEAFAGSLNLTIAEFVRTSSKRHKAFVCAVLQKLHDGDHFYQAEYRGFYSARQETFLTEKDRREDGTFDPLYGEVAELVEHNYYFKLSEHQQWLIDHIEANPDFVQPATRRNEVLGFLKNNTLEDLCITRPKERLEWGIPLPFDEDYVTYVWFDALSNYTSIPAALGDTAVAGPIGLEVKPDAPSLWPADIHIIGKDILKFHAVYWPIMLKAMELPLPGQVLVHGWWQKDGKKMSKTTGNVVDPVAVIDEWGVDAFRYYVVRELDIGPDGNWTDESFQARYSAELANGLGNLVNRSLSMLNRYRGGTLETTSDELAEDANKWIAEARMNYKSHRIQAALVSVWGLVDRANQYVEQTAPFKLAKQEDQADRLNEVLYNLAESCRILAVLLWPVIPDTAEKIFEQLGLDGSPADFSLAEWGDLAKGHTCNKPTPLFPRKDLEKK
jgi:methionyl-tRNA synthetase